MDNPATGPAEDSAHAPSPEVREETRRILTESRAILTGDHFVYDSSEHGDAWIDKDAIFPHPLKIERLGALLAEVARDLVPEVVCGPAVGGIIVAQRVASHLGVLSIFTEKRTNAKGMAEFALRRHFDRLVAGRRVLVVDDVINTGYATLETIVSLRRARAKIVGVATLITRGGATAKSLGVPTLRALDAMAMASWPASHCPLCAKGAPVNTHYGHGSSFVAAQAHIMEDT